jgi:CP family cyanate transporter-like MFS transporter
MQANIKPGGLPLHPSWVIVLAGVCAALHVGKLPPALPVLQTALDISLVQASFLLSALQIAGMTLGLVVGLTADGIGLRRSMLMGLALLAFASSCGGFVSTASSMLWLRTLEGVGFLLVVMPAPALIRRTVTSQQLDTRMGWWGTYMPAGSALALLCGPWMIAHSSWEVWWWLLALISAVAWLAVCWCVPTVPRASAHADETWYQRLALTLKAPGAWWVAMAFAVYSSQWMAVIGFLPTVYLEMGLSASTTGLMTASVAMVNVIGNVFSGRLLHRGWPARAVLIFGYASMAVGACGAFGQWDGWSLPPTWSFMCVVVFSAAGGVVPGTLFATAVRVAPSEATVSTVVGYMQQWSAFGQFAGPPLVAWVATLVGGWQWTWAVTTSLCVVGFVLAFKIGSLLETSTKEQQASV